MPCYQADQLFLNLAHPSHSALDMLGSHALSAILGLCASQALWPVWRTDPVSSHPRGAREVDQTRVLSWARPQEHAYNGGIDQSVVRLRIPAWIGGNQGDLQSPCRCTPFSFAQQLHGTRSGIGALVPGEEGDEALWALCVPPSGRMRDHLVCLRPLACGFTS